MSELSKYFKSQTVEVQRSVIRMANYNPRKITEKAQAAIKRNLKSVGLLGGLVWNEHTGNLVSGHQRLTILDILQKYDGTPATDYLVKVEKVNLDEKTEKEQNIFMNSQSVQGEFDNDILAGLLNEIDANLAGLDENDINLIIAESPVFDFGDNEEVKSDIKAMEKPYEERKQMIKDMKAAQKEALETKFEGEPYFTMSFDSFENKAEFLERFGFNPSDKFIKGEIFAEKI
jgi:hypothetical protein